VSGIYYNCVPFFLSSMYALTTYVGRVTSILFVFSSLYKHVCEDTGNMGNNKKYILSSVAHPKNAYLHIPFDQA
jgi:hypothetical protein